MIVDAPFVRPPRPRAVRMAAWAPALRVGGPTRGQKSLGFLGLSFNLDQTTIVTAAIGGAGILFSDAFDPPASMLVKIGGFVALGYAGYHLLFEGEAGAKKEPLSPSEGPIESKGNVGLVDARIVNPIGMMVAKRASADSYNVLFELHNKDVAPVTVPLEFRVAYYEENGTAVLRIYIWSVDVPAGGYTTFPSTVKPDVDIVNPRVASGALYIADRLVAPAVKFYLD